MTAERAIDRRAALGLVLGVSLGASYRWARQGVQPDSAVALWVADRDAGRVIGLDPDFLIRKLIPLARPVALASAPGGGVWVISALGNSRHDEEFEWLRLGADGQLLGRGELFGFRQIRSAPNGGAWILGGLGRALDTVGVDGCFMELEGSRIRAGGPLERSPADEFAIGAEANLVVMKAQRMVARFDGTAFLERRCFASRPIEACASGSGWWVLTERELFALHSDLSLQTSFELSRPGAALIESSATDGVWVVDRRGDRAAYFEPERGFRYEREWSAAGACRGLELPRRALIVATPGALIVMDRYGGSRAGQGGFRHLVDLALARYDWPLAKPSG